MKIVFAPDSFKECMTAQKAAESMEQGFRAIFPEAEYVQVPMADGGEGTAQSLIDATGGKRIEVPVIGPLGHEIISSFGILGTSNTAIIEMAAASGLELVPKEKRNPLITTTYGTGQLLKAALDHGVKTIIIGIGGSATNDGGAGMFQALGGKLLDKDGQDLPYGGGTLGKLDRIDISGLHPAAKHTEVIVACDVSNPLTGETGAAAIFGPQKGATPEMVKTLDANLAHYASVIRTQLKVDMEKVPGAGAAGGLGGGLMAFLGARLQKGVDIVIEYSHLEDKMKGADLVITGEGGIDGQTRFGKTPFGVAKVAQAHKIPVIALAGNVKADSDILFEFGFDAIFPIVQGAVSLDEALAQGPENVRRTAENVARLYKIFQAK